MSRRPPDPRSPKELWDEQHQLLSTHSVPWVVKADELIAAFELVASQDGLRTDKPPQVSGVAYMLGGFAIEVLMKAVLIQKGQGGTDAGGKFVLRSHDLINLASDCGYSLSDEKQRLLERLRDYIEWAGRYPVSMKSDVMQPRPLPSGGLAPVTAHWTGEDWAAIRAFITELKSYLPKIRYPEKL